jgi:NAD(P)-dependent dehydrogenase (short-subunit alcohol dehydrogenase family)
MTRPTVAVVTGAGSGIGRGAALRLARDGHAVGLLDSDGDAVGETLALIPPTAPSHAVTADVTDAGAVEAAMAEITTTLGTPSVLVNSAGILIASPFVEIDVAAWRRVLDVNVTGTFLCTQAVVRRLVADHLPGTVVNVASVHSEAPGPGLAAYDASKGALRMLTRSLARELGPQGIRVNAVAPGAVQSHLAGGIGEDYRRKLESALPLGRVGQPADVAGVIAFLCSPDAAYMTGSMVVVDGGMLLTAHT